VQVRAFNPAGGAITIGGKFLRHAHDGRERENEKGVGRLEN